MTRSNGNTELAERPTVDIMERPITFRPFMSNKDITLTANMVLKMIAKPTKSGKLPTPADAIRFAMLCEARALNPWEGDAFLVGFDSQDGPQFNLITAHQAFLKRAEVHPEYDGMESGVTVKNKDGETIDIPGDFVDDNQVLVGGWSRVHFKNRKIPTYRRVALKTFNSGRSRWAKDPCGMIVKCAEADGLRSSFPTKLGGLYLNEEFDAMGEAHIIKAPVAMPKALDDGRTLDTSTSQVEPEADTDTGEAPSPSGAADNSLPPSQQTPPTAGTANSAAPSPVEAFIVTVMETYGVDSARAKELAKLNVRGWPTPKGAAIKAALKDIADDRWAGMKRN